MHKYFLYITGCDMNYSDAERIAGVFNEHGFRLASSEKEADIIVAVACSVREKAVHKILGKVHEWRKLDRNDRRQSVTGKITDYRPSIQNAGFNRPILMVTGCILDQDKKKFEERADLVFEIKDIQKLEKFLGSITYYVSCIKQGKKNHNTKYMIHDTENGLAKENGYLSISPLYQSSYSANVPIMTGCDNFCTYCAVPYTRGREVSRPEEYILREVAGLVEAGYKEITLLGQNVNSYGINNKFQISNNKQKPNDNPPAGGKNPNDFVKLLEKVDAIPGDYWVRFYSNHPKDFSDELIDFLATPRHFCHYIHLPLQSGDDGIIKKMNRHYTAKQYLEIIKKIREKIPDCAITTDIIVGFPGETEAQFQNTVTVLEKVGFDMIFISEYSPRSGTPAAKLEDDVPHQEKGRRKKYLNDVVLANSVLKHNKKLVGKKVRILVYKQDKKGFFVGKTAGLKDVRFSIIETQGFASLRGAFIDVKITKATSWGLEGELT